MTVSIPFPLPARGFALNSKVRVNLDFIVSKFNEFNTGTATWDNVFIGTPNVSSGALVFYNSSNTNYIQFTAGATAANLSFTWPINYPLAGGGNYLTLTSSTGVMSYDDIEWLVDNHTGLVAIGTTGNSLLSLYSGYNNGFVRQPNATTVPAFVEIKGTSNQITVTHNAADTTFSLPQSIATNSTVNFGGINVGSGSLAAPSIFMGVISGLGDRAGQGFYRDANGLYAVDYADTAPGQINAVLFQSNKTTFLSNYDLTLAATRNIILTDDSTNTLTIALPSAVTTYTLTLPANDGAANQYLTTDGSGTTSWTNAAGTGTVNSGTQYQLAYYATSAAAVSGLTLITASRMLRSDTNGLPVANDAITASRAVASDASGFLVAATTTATELGYVNGVTSAIQTQLGNKAPIASPTFTGVITLPNGSAAAPSVTFANDATVNTGLYSQAEGYINFTINGVDAAYIDSSRAFNLYPTTTTKGILQIKAADNAGTTTTLITNASQAGTRTYTIPDAGASAEFVMGLGTQTIGGLKTFSLDTTWAAGKNLILTDDSTNTVTIALPAAVTTYTLTLPINDGGAGEVLSTDGSGVTSWVAAAAGAATSLNNLAAVAINTSLISDADNTDDLGSTTKGWAKLYMNDGAVGTPSITFSDDPDNGMYRIGTNNVGIATAGNKAIDISAAGEVTQPLQPSFLVWLDNDLLNVTGDNTAYTVIFDTEDYDLGADMTLASSTFTAPVSGVYQLSATVDLQNIAGFTIKTMYLKTSSHNYYVADADAGGFVEERRTLLNSVTCYMDVNDTATVVVTVGAAAKTVDLNGGNSTSLTCYFSGSLLN